MNQFYYIAGSDGSGKSTFLKDIENHLQEKGLKTKYLWIRSPKILSKPLMGYCRFIKLTTYKTIGGIKYGKHEFYRSKFVSWLFPKLQLIDFKIKWFILKQKIKPDEVILFDRFSLDTLVDLMVGTKRYDLHKSNVGKNFLKLIPPNSRIMILKVDEHLIRQRKLDTLHDEQLGDRINAFELLSRYFNIQQVDNNGDYNLAKEKIIKYMIDG